MKKYIVVIILFTFMLPLAAFSQFSNYGVKFGVESAGAKNTPNFADGRLVGISVYGFADLNILRNISSTIDLGVTQRGYTSSQIQTNEQGEFIKKVTATSRLTYISLAPFVNLDAPISGVSLFAGVAPRFDLLIYRSPGSYAFSGYYPAVKDQLPHYLNRSIFGASFAAGIKNVVIDHIGFRLEGKYEMDITDSMSKYPAKYRNNVFMLVLGVNL